MDPTLRTVLSLPGRPVVLRAGAEQLDRPVRWVAVSELADPTPYLEGGELLLTTGIRLRPSRCDAYVQRLVAARVAALGLGVGLTHATVPSELITAAERHGLPLLEVPEPTPFIAVSKAVSDALAAAEYEGVTRAVESQRDLTRAALADDGAAAVVARLAKELSAAVLLLEPSGVVSQAAGEVGDELTGQVQAEVQRMRERGGRTSASLSDARRHVVVQPLSPAGRVRGFLAVARGEPFRTVDHSLVIVSVALVSLLLERSAGSVAVMGRLGDAVLDMLLDGVAVDRLPLVDLRWGWVADGPVRVLLADGSGQALAAWRQAAADGASSDGVPAAGRLGDRLVVLLPADPADAGVAATTALGPELAWGVSEPVAVATLADGLRQAGQALAAGRGLGVHWFRTLGEGGLVSLVDVEAARGMADRLLRPLVATGRGDLLTSVRAWLGHNGHWDAAAASLGVHRHTLRHRMRRVEELLGRSLDDPDLRAELWVALGVRDRYGSE